MLLPHCTHAEEQKEAKEAGHPRALYRLLHIQGTESDNAISLVLEVVHRSLGQSSTVS